MQRTDSSEKTLMLGKIEGRRRGGQQRMRWLDGITFNGHEFEQALGVGDRQGSLVCRSTWGRKELDTTELNWKPTGNDWRREEVCCQEQHLEEPRCREHSRLLSLPLSGIPPVLLSQLSESSLTSSLSLHQRCPPHTHPAVYRMGRAFD